MAYELYHTLEIAEDATAEQVRKAYFSLVRKHSPEKEPEKFKQIRLAYETLMDSKARQNYDAIQRYGDEIELLNIEADQYVENENWIEAIRIYKRILVLAPELDGIRNFLGLCYSYSEQFDEAIKTYYGLVNKTPDVPVYWHNYGIALKDKALSLDDSEASGDDYSRILNSSLDCFNQAIGLEPYNVQNYIMAAEVNRHMELWDDAIAYAGRGISADGEVNIQDYDCLFEIYSINIDAKRFSDLPGVLNLIDELLIEDPEAKEYVVLNFSKYANAAAHHFCFRVAALYAEAAIYFGCTDENLIELHEACAMMADVYDEYPKLKDDITIVSPFIRLTAISVNDVYDEEELEANEREAIIKDIFQELNTLDPREIKSSLRQLKIRYPGTYKLNQELYIKIEGEIDETPSTTATSSSKSEGGEGCGLAIIFGFIGALVGGPVGAIIGVVIGLNIASEK